MSRPGNSVQLHRILRAPPDRVYRAFVDPDAVVKWMAPHGFVAKVHAYEPRVGGSFRMSFINFGTGKGHTFGGVYLEMVPGELLRYSDKFDDPSMPGEIMVTVRFRKVLCGTELTIVQEGLPEAIPTEFCYQGWQESLHLLAHVVEPEIPDGP